MHALRVSTIRHSFWIVPILILLASVTLRAQQREPRNSVGVSYSSFRFRPHDQYLGGGVEYRYMHRSWVGFKVQASQFPEYQMDADSEAGYEMGQIDGSGLLGHRWGKVTLLGETGFGVMRSMVFAGYRSGGGNLYQERNYPDLLMGGLVDVSLARRWSITYEVRDNLIFIGPFQQIGTNSPLFFYAAHKLHVPEGSIGVAFHF